MEGTVFKEKVGSSHVKLEYYKISFYKNFLYLLKIKYFHFHEVVEGSLKWDGSEEPLVTQGALFLNSDMAQVTPVAGAQLFAEKRSFSTVLGCDPNTCSLTLKAGFTGGCLTVFTGKEGT